jgi:hypothetical protein
LEGLVHGGRFQHGWIEQGVAAEEAFFRQGEVGVGRLDHQDRR